MKTLTSALFGLFAMLALTSNASAFSPSGVYFEVGSSAIGSELDGKIVETATTPNETTTGQVGKTAVTTTLSLGFMTDRSRKLGLDLGYSQMPGSASIKSKTTDGTTSNVTFELSDANETYLAPMLNITEDASLYLKFGWNSTDIKVIGDTTKPTSMDGETLALGTIMSWGSNVYIKTEAGITDYDKITVTGLGSGIPTTTTVSATPTVHYGKIAIGYKF
jgi:hypothetical protein